MNLNIHTKQKTKRSKIIKTIKLITTLTKQIVTNKKPPKNIQTLTNDNNLYKH